MCFQHLDHTIIVTVARRLNDTDHKTLNLYHEVFIIYFNSIILDSIIKGHSSARLAAMTISFLSSMPFTHPSSSGHYGPRWDKWHSTTWNFNAQHWITVGGRSSLHTCEPYHTLFETIAACILWLFVSFVCVSSCSHGDKAGQELCYLCHQRAQKNIPIYFSEERRQRELEQDRLLQQYQQQKNSEAISKEQVLTITSSFTVQ